VKALGLTFGAVDLGLTPTGKFKILEVNRAPGIEGSTIEAYVKAINKWIEGAE
jgi:glutathione synthase/RimK-type ligase-like ATP-grasp enzyme